MLHKKIILLLTGLLVLQIFGAGPSLVLAWTEQSSKEKICSNLNPDLNFNNFTYRVTSPSGKHRFIIPELPVTTRASFSISLRPATGDVAIGMRYADPVSSKVCTHSPPESGDFRYLTDLQGKNAVACWSTITGISRNIFSFSSATTITQAAGDYFYVEIVQGASRILSILMQLSVDTAEAQKWCQQSGSQPLAPQVIPASGTFFASQDIQITSTFADQIYYLQTTSTDPDEAAAGITQTPSAVNSNGVINASSGKITLTAPEAGYTQYKLRFAGYNEYGNTVSSVYTYTIDRRPVEVGAVSVIPDGASTDGTSLTLSQIRAENATKICYTVTESINGQDPEIPGNPTTSSSAVCNISGPAGTHTLSTRPDEEKIVWIRFAGYNENNPAENRYGPPSNPFKYLLKGTARIPGKVTADPSRGTFTARQNVRVSSLNATVIHYTTTSDNSTPGDPKDSVYTGKIDGSDGSAAIAAQDGRRITVKMRFRGYNSNSSEWGPDSTFTYVMDLSGSQPSPDPPPQPSPDKEACIKAGGEWVSLLFFEFCVGGQTGSSGSVRVSILPAQAREAGAMWRVHSGEWLGSGQIASQLPDGNYSITFKPVEGWFPPILSVAVVRGNAVVRNAEYRAIKKDFTLTSDEARAHPGIDITAALQRSPIDPNIKLLDIDGNGHLLSPKELIELFLAESFQNDPRAELPDEIWLHENGRDLIWLIQTQQGFNVQPMRLTRVKTTSEQNDFLFGDTGNLIFNVHGLKLTLESVCYDMDWIHTFLAPLSVAEFSDGALKVSVDDFKVIAKCAFASSQEYPEGTVYLEANPEDAFAVRQRFVPYLYDTMSVADIFDETDLNFNVDPVTGCWLIYHDGILIYSGIPDFIQDKHHTSPELTFDAVDVDGDGELDVIVESEAGRQTFFTRYPVCP